MSRPLRGDFSSQDLKQLYEDCQERELKERLLALKLVYSGRKVTEVASYLQISHKTIYNWIDLWNEGGIEKLAPKKRGKGKKAYLSLEEWQKIVREIEGKGYNIEKVQEYVEKTRGIKYSYKGVWNVLRRNLRIPYGKPYVLIEKQSETAEEELKKNCFLSKKNFKKSQ